MKKLKESYKKYFVNKHFLVSLITSFIFLIISIIISLYAGNYATEKASLPVTDIILSNIRVYDVDMIFVYGPLIFFILLTIILLNKINKVPFVLKSLALFIIIRSIFISLTHIGPFPSITLIESNNFISKFSSGGDLFFSGHTGIPFLMSLIFWDDKILKYVFLIYSIFIGTVVLLGHYHYSIDVLAAFFITYSILHLSLYFFKKEKEMFDDKLNTI